MSGINLLPPEFKQAKKRTELNTKVVSAGLYIILLFLIILGLVEMANRFVATEYSQNQTQIKQTENDINQLKDVENLTKDLNALLKTTDEIKANQIFWSQAFNEIAASTPFRLQLNAFSITSDKSPNFTISGFAESVREIAKFKEKIEASPYFNNTAFSAANQSESQGKISFGFTITTDLEKRK